MECICQGIASKATASVRMPVANITDISPDLTYERTVDLLADAYGNRMNTSKVTNLLCT